MHHTNTFGAEGLGCNIQALTTRNGFGGTVYCNYNKEPPPKKKNLVEGFRAPTFGAGTQRASLEKRRSSTHRGLEATKPPTFNSVII